MAASFGWVLRELSILLPNDRVTLSLSVENVFAGALGGQLLAFAASALLCHLLLGIVAFLLARTTESAFPGRVAARRGWLVTCWFAVLMALVIAGNATWHPASMFADEEGWLLNDVMGVYPVTLAAAAAAAAVLYLSARAAMNPSRSPAITRLAVATAACAVLWMLAEAPHARAGSSVAAVDADLPHVVIIGLDSLRADLVGTQGTDSLTPQVDRFLDGAHHFTDTISPLSRTYGSWVSILTGRHPVSTNARVNLMPRALVRPRDTLADALGEHGYRATYATDEVRFANIDESFGFDEVLTPPMGAADFLLGYAGDQPLVNLVAPTALGGRLFPWNHANRASHVTYDPADFVARLDRGLDVEGPSFVAIHLTLAHWPYSWSGMATPGNQQEYPTAYRHAVNAVDRQFGDVLQVLARKGILENAIVVLLSDHGEALGWPTDSMLRRTGTSREIWDSLWGHGSSVMSPHQYEVLFAMRAFGRARIPGRASAHDWPVSLEDIRPTVEELVTARSPGDTDGVSLMRYLDGSASDTELRGRIRFTETDFNTPSTLAGRFEASGIVDEASVYYELDPASGWVQFRADRLPELLARKQRAALSPDALLAALPGPSPETVRYLYTTRRDPFPAVLEGNPDGWEDAEAQRLWGALAARFPGELAREAHRPRM